MLIVFRLFEQISDQIAKIIFEYLNDGIKFKEASTETPGEFNALYVFESN